MFCWDSIVPSDVKGGLEEGASHLKIYAYDAIRCGCDKTMAESETVTNTVTILMTMTSL